MITKIEIEDPLNERNIYITFWSDKGGYKTFDVNLATLTSSQIEYWRKVLSNWAWSTDEELSFDNNLKALWFNTVGPNLSDDLDDGLSYVFRPIEADHAQELAYDDTKHLLSFDMSDEEIKAHDEAFKAAYECRLKELMEQSA